MWFTMRLQTGAICRGRSALAIFRDQTKAFRALARKAD